MVNSNVNKPIELVVNEHKHFHPSANLEPSKADVRAYRQDDKGRRFNGDSVN